MEDTQILHNGKGRLMQYNFVHVAVKKEEELITWDQGYFIFLYYNIQIIYNEAACSSTRGGNSAAKGIERGLVF